MKTYLRNFSNSLTASKNSIGLFYFGGHGIQSKGENYLIPIGAMIEKEPDIELETISLKRVMGEMYNDSIMINFIILDASRRNGITRLWANDKNLGLARVFPDAYYYYMSSTTPGNVTTDGNSEMGIYANALLKYLAVPNQNFIDFLKSVRRDVYTSTNKKQIPYDNGETPYDFYFNKTE